ncbi:MAG: protein translocase subunit SecD [Defluviitaleaceae bacterium]|nr:protein translocase subunit SecD [Defluviitaleaceae bacterium]MCL2275904.1 protein translocase subunit SecD [Defluviitaleaceae bacterium]
MKAKSALFLLLIFIATAGLGLLTFFGVPWGEDSFGGIADIRQGLDLRGGVSILYEADIDGANPSLEEMNLTNSLLRNRLDSRGYLEATATLEGTRQIRVEIPGVEDAAAAVAAIGRTAQLTFEDMAGNVLLTGRDVATARAPGAQQLQPGRAPEYIVEVTFTPQGTQLFAEATRANFRQQIVIALDGEVISAPVVQAVIDTGSTVISGTFNRDSARELAEFIQQGALPVNLNVISENYIGARLGVDALETSIIAGIIGLALVLIFMAIVYRTMGICADWALIIYVILVLLVLSAFQITLSLPAIAGIILSIGMAVDANVVIFERIREEVRMGKTLRSAVRMGYRRALPAVVDSNVTTLIAGIVLFWLGTGPIMGFAQILIIGILVSMFTCLLVTRILTVCLMELGVIRTAHFTKRGFFEKKTEAPAENVDSDNEAEPIKIVERRKWYFAFSCAVLTLGLLSAVVHSTRGNGFFNLDVEFSGGTQFIVDDIHPSYDISQIEDIVRRATGISAPQVQEILGTQQFMIRIPQTDTQTRETLMQYMTSHFKLDVGESFSYSTVSPAVSAAMQRSALMAIGVASLAMLVYISIRFRDIRTGGSAVLAQLHDALVVLCVYAILRIPLNYAFIAVMLTTLGYSINATIIVFDRVRENRGRMPKAGAGLLVNTSVTQTLRRTLFSTVSTFLAVGALYIIGVASIQDFTLPIIVGLLFGAYSSVLLSGSAWFMMRGEK